MPYGAQRNTSYLSQYSSLTAALHWALGIGRKHEHAQPHLPTLPPWTTGLEMSSISFISILLYTIARLDPEYIEDKFLPQPTSQNSPTHLRIPALTKLVSWLSCAPDSQWIGGTKTILVNPWRFEECWWLIVVWWGWVWRVGLHVQDTLHKRILVVLHLVTRLFWSATDGDNSPAEWPCPGGEGTWFHN